MLGMFSQFVCLILVHSFIWWSILAPGHCWIPDISCEKSTAWKIVSYMRKGRNPKTANTECTVITQMLSIKIVGWIERNEYICLGWDGQYYLLLSKMQMYLFPIIVCVGTPWCLWVNDPPQIFAYSIAIFLQYTLIIIVPYYLLCVSVKLTIHYAQ